MEMQGYEAAAAQAPARLGPADPQSSQGKALYVGNLHSSVSQEMLQVWAAGAHYCHRHHLPARAPTPGCAFVVRGDPRECLRARVRRMAVWVPD